MNRLHPHRFWIGTLVFSIVLMTASSPLLRVAGDEAGRKLAHVKAERTRTEQSLHQLEEDIATVQKLSGEISLAEAEQWLAPVDRLRAASILERQADDARLGRFVYSLSPEQKTIIETLAAGPQELAVSTITVSADAGLDTDIYGFINNLPQYLPGRLRLQQMTLQRNGNGDSGVSATNLHFSATFEWLSNGATKDLAGAP